MSDFEDISAVIRKYLDGLYHCDIDLLGQVFHQQAVYATADETPALIRTMDEYFPVVAARVSSASRGEPLNGTIESIELAGKNTAIARVRCSMAGNDYVDFLSFIRTEGAWRIIAKVFQMTTQTDKGEP